jgi:hypothetical protein
LLQVIEIKTIHFVDQLQALRTTLQSGEI